MDTSINVWQSVRHWVFNFDNWPTVIIAAAAVFISYQQWKLAQNKFKHDLYEKRLEIYLGAEEFLNSIWKNGRATNEAIINLRQCIHKSTFLISQSDFNYLKCFEERALRLQLGENMRPQFAEKVAEGDKYANDQDTAILKEAGDINKWFLDQPLELKERFFKYLKLD